MPTEANGDQTGNTDTKGQQGNTSESASDEPQYITKDDLVKQVNSIMTNHIKRYENKQNERFTSLETLLKGASGNTKTDEEGHSDETDQNPQPTKKPEQTQANPNRPDPAVRELTKQLEALKKQLDAEKAEKETERAKASEAKTRATVVDVITGLGSDKGSQVFKLLKDQFIEEEGQIKVKMEVDGYEEIRDLKSGLHDWLQSDEGKHFLPPKNLQGSGAGNNNNSGNNGGGKTYTMTELDNMKPSEYAKLPIKDLIDGGKIIS